MLQAPADWVDVGNGRALASDYLSWQGEALTLGSASRMDLDAFNREARPYEVRMDPQDPPIGRLIKVDLYISRVLQDGAAIPPFGELGEALLDLAAGKGEEPHKSLYKKLAAGPALATRDLLRFQGEDRPGAYRADVWRYNEEGILVPIAEGVRGIRVADQGWQRALGPAYGFPLVTSRVEHGPLAFEAVDRARLEEGDRTGFLFLGDEPQPGEFRLVLRDPRPSWRDGGLLGAGLGGGRGSAHEGVAALRMRHVRKAA